VTFCLDTSALLAHYRDEAGGDRVQEIMDGDRVFVVSITITEFFRITGSCFPALPRLMKKPPSGLLKSAPGRLGEFL